MIVVTFLFFSLLLSLLQIVINSFRFHSYYPVIELIAAALHSVVFNTCNYTSQATICVACDGDSFATSSKINKLPNDFGGVIRLLPSAKNNL